MKIAFTKMHGAGNDFIVVDDRNATFPLEDRAFLQRITMRRTGVGCDGIILMQSSAQADVRMRFFNPDGREQEMCGNGARCLARFAVNLGAAGAEMRIEVGAGILPARMVDETAVCLEMGDPVDLQMDLALGLEWVVDAIDTGVPHAVVWVDDVESVDLVKWGSMLRYHPLFEPGGTNANFVAVESPNTIRLRTYERGVEAETWACGTGAVASAVLAAERGKVNFPVTVHCIGGEDLVVNRICGKTTLTGGAVVVFDGEVEYGNRV